MEELKRAPATNSPEEIFAQFKNKVYRLALSITRNEKDAEDVTQNTFLKIIKNLAYFRHESLLSTWIYRIAYNEALMYLKKRKNQVRLAGYLSRSKDNRANGLFVNWSKLPDRLLLDNELKERIDLAISRLPIKYRMALLLDNVEELPLKESSKILGLKLNSLKTRLHRAHLAIKSDIAGYFKDKEAKQEKNNKSCSIWMNFVYDYAKGSLGEERSLAFKRHIRGCLACNDFLEDYLQAIKITGALTCRDLPPELKTKIETFLKERKPH